MGSAKLTSAALPPHCSIFSLLFAKIVEEKNKRFQQIFIGLPRKTKEEEKTKTNISVIEKLVKL